MKQYLAVLSLSIWLSTAFLLSANDHTNSYYWPGTLLEPAWGLENRAAQFFAIAEFEEDSGDFPTTKLGLRYARGLSRGFGLRASAQLIRFNLGDYTAWGGGETELGLRWKSFEGSGYRPTFQLKGDIYIPTGGMSSTDWAASGGLNMSWKLEDWGIHLNGFYTGGEGAPEIGGE